MEKVESNVAAIRRQNDYYPARKPAPEPKPLPPKLPTMKPTGKYPNILEEAINTAQSYDDALYKIDCYIQDAKESKRIPDMKSILASVASLSVKFTHEDIRKAIVVGSQRIFDKLFQPKNMVCETLFFPSEENENEIIRFLKCAKRYMYVAIYTVTNDRLARVLYSLFKQGVDVRVLTDDETMDGKGCNIRDLANAGIPVRTDKTKTARMHHKFMVIDDELLLNGSFNWTVTAVKSNNENIVITTEKSLVDAFKKEFLRLWDLYRDCTIPGNGQVNPVLVEYEKKFSAYERKAVERVVNYLCWDDIGARLQEYDGSI